MENQNEVTLTSIRKESSGELGFKAKIFSMLMVVMTIGIISLAPLHDAERLNLFACMFASVVVLNIAAYFVGRHSKYFQRKACIKWYENDIARIQIFEEEKERSKQQFEESLKEVVAILLAEEPENREKIKEEAVQMVKKSLVDLEQQQDKLMGNLRNNEVELIHILQAKSRFEELGEQLTEWLLDFIITLQKEEANEELVKKRIEKVIRENNISALNERLSYYDTLIASCEKSTSDLAKVLEERYGYNIEQKTHQQISA